MGLELSPALPPPFSSFCHSIADSFLLFSFFSSFNLSRFQLVVGNVKSCNFIVFKTYNLSIKFTCDDTYILTRSLTAEQSSRVRIPSRTTISVEKCLFSAILHLGTHGVPAFGALAGVKASEKMLLHQVCVKYHRTHHKKQDRRVLYDQMYFAEVGVKFCKMPHEKKRPRIF